MKGTSKCDYLQFNNLWQRKKGYEAHKRRLNSVKGSEYFKQIEKDQIDDIVNHQI